MIKEIRVPEISENVTSGSVVEVFVAPGDSVNVDDPIIEFETDKAVVEIPSPYDGQITEILVKAGDDLNVGDVVAKIETEKDAGAEPAQAEGEPEEAQEDQAEEVQPQRVSAEQAPREEEELRKISEQKEKETAEDEERKPEMSTEPEPDTEKSEKKPTREPEENRQPADTGDEKRRPAPASPSVRRLARELGVDIDSVHPSGERISEADVKAHVQKQLAKEEKRGAPAPAPGSSGQPALPDFSRWGEVEIQELTSVRRLTAASVAASRQTVVPVTQFEGVDITAAEEFMRRNADRVADQGGKLTVTAVLMKVCAAALRKFPSFNASIDPANNRLIIKKYVHIGVAVDTPRGLLVPVVRNVDRKTILELAVEIVDLAHRARSKKIGPDEMEGGTFTISNQGGIGGTNFTPVVLWPQAAILGVSRVTTEPRYEEGEFRPRKILPLALSYDHRIADGADAARFVRWIREGIEHPLTLHLY
jgi:pyruvate dehydrogenase E2 component (dihydrolipoamide acetyltransferase)